MRHTLIVIVLTSIVLLVPGCGRRTPETEEAPSHLVELTTAAQFTAEVLKSDLPCVVGFYADWCGPCQKLKPLLNELAPEWQGRIRFFMVNVDDSGDLADQFGVETIPDVRFFKAGEPAGGTVGFCGREYWQGEFARLAPPGQ